MRSKLKFSRVGAGWRLSSAKRRDDVLSVAVDAWKEAGLGIAIVDQDGVLSEHGILAVATVPGNLVLVTVWVEAGMHQRARDFTRLLGAALGGSSLSFEGETEVDAGYTARTIRPHVAGRLDHFMLLRAARLTS